ncbi:MAG: membrane dipeptidase [Verrucomicrobiota bacterium]
MPPLARRHFLTQSLAAAVGGGLTIISSQKRSIAQQAAQPTAEPNPVIENARQAALDILKPSKKDLEHGLELHRQSLVFDGYGFSPRCAIDGERLKKAIAAKASPLELKDMREDMGMTRCASDPVERKEFEQAWQASGVSCIFQNAGEEGQDPMILIKRLANFTYLTDMMKDFIVKAATPDDIEAAWKAGKRSLYLTGNGVPITQAWVSVPDEMRYIRVFFELGIRMMHITYNRRNMIGDGCAEPANGGLSDFGRSAVKELNRIGVIADVAHSGWQTSLETAQVSEQPMVASHTTCKSINEHIRSKPDKVIKAIADTGGYIGICCIPSFLNAKHDGDISAMLNNIDYVKKKFGVEHVTIGTDVAYSSRNSKAENKKGGPAPRTSKPWRSLWPEGSLGSNAKASQTMAWTNWPLFTVGMVQRGYSDEDIQKILAGNVMRVARAVLKNRSVR